MRDTRDRWRSGLPVPFRNRPQRPAALPHAPGGEEPRQASRSRRSNERMACETTREENALSDSGPLRPACDEEVLTYDVRVSNRVRRRRLRRIQTYTGLPIHNKVMRSNRGRNRPNFDGAWMMFVRTI